MRLRVPGNKYRADEQRHRCTTSCSSVKAIPGVQSVGAVQALPLGGDDFNVWRAAIPEGRPMSPDPASDAQNLPVMLGYFETLQIPLKAGRLFTDQDDLKSPPVVIINENLRESCGRTRTLLVVALRSGATKMFGVKWSELSVIRKIRSTKCR